MTTIQILGYIASVIIAVGMLMSSLRLLRWINFAGALLFSIYGFLIKAYPVGIVNGFIAIVDVYYLGTMYLKKDLFKVLPVRGDNKLLLEFLEFYKTDILKFFPDFIYKAEKNKYSFFVLRNMAIAGVILASDYEPNVLRIYLDFAVPQFRDYKIGKFLYNNYIEKFKEDGYKLLIAFPSRKIYKRYLHRMGFVYANYDGKNAYVKNLTV